MAGLVPAIHVLARCAIDRSWMPATSAGMTVAGFGPLFAPPVLATTRANQDDRSNGQETKRQRAQKRQKRREKRA
jgi:hypothetical protein